MFQIWSPLTQDDHQPLPAHWRPPAAGLGAAGAPGVRVEPQGLVDPEDGAGLHPLQLQPRPHLQVHQALSDSLLILQ